MSSWHKAAERLPDRYLGMVQLGWDGGGGGGGFEIRGGSGVT